MVVHKMSSDILQTILKYLQSIMPPEMKSIINPDISFIEMGMDSLLIASLELHLQKHFGVENGFLAQHKSPRECAEKLNSINNVLNLQVYPLSQAQKRLIFSASEPFEKIKIKVPNLDKGKFVNAWKLISSRHSILRTKLSLIGQKVVEFPIEISNDVLECPLRVELNENTILLEYHHALIDGTSINILMNELWDAYENFEEVAKRSIPLQYYDYCKFEEKYLIENSKKWPQIVDYWTNELKGFEENNSFDKNGESLSIEMQLESQLSQNLKIFAQQNQLTLFNLMSGLLRLLFYKLYDADDLIIAFPVEQRLHADFEKTIGLFMNINLCRFRLNAEKSVSEFLKDVAQKTSESLSNGFIPFNQLVNHLQSNGIIESENQLLQLIAVDDKQAYKSLVEVETMGHSMNYPQIWYFQHNNQGIRLRIEFGIFNEEKIKDELKFFEVLCRKFVQTPNLKIKEIYLVDEFIDLESTITDDFLHKMLEKLNDLPSDKIVLIGTDGQKFTSQQLLDQIWMVAANLKTLIGKTNEEVFVALILPRSSQLIITLLGAWLNNFIVIPLNSDQFLKKLPEHTFLITDQQIDFHSTIPTRKLFESQKINKELPFLNPNDLCYGTFTSGSTGESKLVLSERIGLLNLLANYTRQFGYDEESVIYQVVNPAFDIFLADLVVSLANGGTLVLAKNQIPSVKEIGEFYDLWVIEKYSITHAYIMPAYLPQLCSDHDLKILSKLKVLMFGGESVSEKFIERSLKFNIPMVQLFGFTEHAVYTNYQWINKLDDCRFIGIPFEGTQTVVVDKDGQLKPNGFQGKLASLGIGLCRSYFEDKYSKEFIKIDGKNAFLSGDICRKYNEKIEFLGRKDGIVKIRGQKIQLDSVDKMLSQIVEKSVSVIVEKDKIVSFLMTSKSNEDIQQEIMDKWPNWTVPFKIQRVNEFPLTLNGKIDKQKLKSMIDLLNNQEIVNKEETSNDISNNVSNNISSNILSIFQKFLGPKYNLDDEFLAFGIDSIQLLQVVQELDEKYDIELDVRDAFGSRSARKWMKTQKINNKELNLKIINEGPATWNQEHIWLLRDLSPNESYKIKLKLDFLKEIDTQKLNKAIDRILKENDSLRVQVKMDHGQLKQFIVEKELPFHVLSNNSIQIELDHSIIDGYSLKKIVEDLHKYYKNPSYKSNPSNFSPIQFAKEQREKKFEKELGFFRSEFPNKIDHMPTELPRKNCANEAGHRRIQIQIDSIKRKYNLFYLTLTAYLKQLYMDLDINPLIIGIPFSNRNAKNANAIGYFANSLPILFDMENKNNLELLEHVRERVLKTLEFSELPFAFLVRKLQPNRDQIANPIFQRMVMFEDFSIEANDLFEVHEIDLNYSKFDQTWHIYKSGNFLNLHVEFDKSLFSSNGIQKSLDGFGERLQEILNSAFENDVKAKVFQFFNEELAEFLDSNEFELTEKSNFFELGGHSLNAARLAGRIRMELGFECSTRLIFQNQTVEELANVLEQQINDQFYEVSFIQSTILRAIKDNTLLKDQYCNSFRIQIVNKSKEEIITLLFKMIDEQEALRTKFIITNGQFMAQTLSIENFKLPYIIKSEDFNMETVFIDLNNDKLTFRLSHLISDGNSMQIMMNYLKGNMNLKSIKLLAEFNKKFNEHCEENEENSRKFWSSLLTHPNGQLFRDNNISKKSTSLSTFVKKDGFVEKLKVEKVSPNALFLHQLGSTLRHWQSDNENELYIGVVKDMRSFDFQQTIGFFTQSLPIPCKNRDLKNLNNLLFDVYENAFVKYETLLELSNRSNLFEVMLVVDFEGDFDVNGIEQNGIVNGKFPLTFYVKVRKNDISIELVYWEEFWKEEIAKSMLETFASMVEAKKEIPQNTNLQITQTYIDPIEKIHQIAQIYPNSIAIQSEKTEITYFELIQRLETMSNFIRKKYFDFYGNRQLADSVIMIIGKKSIKSILICLSVMNSGSVYLPIDEELNSMERIQKIYEDTRTKIVISNENGDLFEDWISMDDLWDIDWNVEVGEYKAPSQTNLAYVIYTSGTTGPQKAVQIERQSLWNTIQDAVAFFEVQPSDCVYQFTNFCFDNSVLEIFVALCSGGRLFIDENGFNAEKFQKNVNEFKISHAFLYPGLVETFTEEQLKALCNLKCWIVGAEKLSESLMNKVLQFGANLIQNYGPTETTCYALRRRMQKGDNPQNLGKSVVGLKVRFSEENIPPMAAPRELLIGGIGVMRGYIGDTENRSFVEINGERFYKTGDLCRKTHEGDILFVGRLDSVVKVRGYRVDLNEIETIILRFDYIKQVKVLSDSETIYAFFTSNQQINLTELKKHCSTHLFRYAVPNMFHQVEKMPLTNNNKIDSQILTGMTKSTNKPKIQMNAEKMKLTEIWTDIFNRPIGLEESFFEIGGNSLNAQRMLNKIEELFSIRLTVSDLMENPTISEFKQLLKIEKIHSPKNSNFKIAPLSYQQEQMLFLEEISEIGDYNLQFVQFFNKNLNFQRLFDAIKSLVEKNEILRTRIVEIDNEFYQQIQSSNMEIPKIEQITNEELKELIRKEGLKKFDLFAGPPLDFRFFEVSEKYCLLLKMHHIASDADSTMLIEDQLSKAYNQSEIIHPSLTYAQWSIEQKESFRKFENTAKELSRQFEEIKDLIELRNEINSQGDIRIFEELISLPTQLKTTPFSWICTQLVKTFSSKFQKRTLIIGAPVQNRNEKTERILGNFLNNLIIPLEYDEKCSFVKNLKKNEKLISQSLRYSELPFSFVASEQRQNRIPVYDVYVNFRYSLENESHLTIAEKDANSNDYLLPKCHHLLEIDVDEFNDKFKVVWRTKSSDKLIDELFKEFCNNQTNEKTDIKSVIRQAFRTSLNNNMEFDDNDDYFLIGGTSLSFLRLYRFIKNELKIEDLDATHFLTNCTVNSIHDKILKISNNEQEVLIKFIVNGTSNDAFIFFPTLFGSLLVYQHIFDEFKKNNLEATIIGVDIPDPIKFDSINKLASQCAFNLQKFKNNFENVHFIGASFGALLAYETFSQIERKFKFTSFISIDGIANSNQLNATSTFDEHRQQTENSLISFNLDTKTQEMMIKNSWHLLQLTINHSIHNCPQFDLFLLMTARHSTTKDYGWLLPKSVGMRRLKVDGDHLTMMNEQRSASLLKSVSEEIYRAKKIQKRQ